MKAKLTHYLFESKHGWATVETDKVELCESGSRKDGYVTGTAYGYAGMSSPAMVKNEDLLVFTDWS